MTQRTNDWLRFARDDLRAAQVLFREAVYNLACFHAQQTAEKALKALLAEHGAEIPRLHSLEELLTDCLKIDGKLKQFRPALLELDQYYIPSRYPDAVAGSLPEGLPGRQDAQHALKIAKQVYAAIHKRLS